MVSVDVNHHVYLLQEEEKRGTRVGRVGGGGGQTARVEDIMCHCVVNLTQDQIKSVQGKQEEERSDCSC